MWDLSVLFSIRLHHDAVPFVPGQSHYMPRQTQLCCGASPACRNLGTVELILFRSVPTQLAAFHLGPGKHITKYCAPALDWHRLGALRWSSYTLFRDNSLGFCQDSPSLWLDRPHLSLWFSISKMDLTAVLSHFLSCGAA